MKNINLGIALLAFFIGSVTLLFNAEKVARGCAWMGLSLFNIIMYAVWHFDERIDELKNKK